MKHWIGWVAVLVGLIFQSSLQAQTGTNTVVATVAAEEGLTLLAPDQIPSLGTFWLVTSVSSTYGVSSSPMPCRLPDYSQWNTYVIATGVFLVDQTTNDASEMNSNAVAAEATSLLNLIDREQSAMVTHGFRMAMAMDDSVSDGISSEAGSLFDTNQLWLQITNVVSDLAYANLYNATDQVYAIWSTTNLLSNWQVEMVLWPGNTNCQPFNISTLSRPDLFLQAQDWTGFTENGNTTPDWWFWTYFGTTALSDTNMDDQGNTLLYDYQNGVNPNVIQFSVQVTNKFVSSISAPVLLNITEGIPSYVAISIDDTNYQADASWTAYTSSNLNVNLGFAAGWHDIWIGLRGHGDDPINAVWEWKRLKLMYTPPPLFITSPTNPTVDIPMIQLQGFSPEPLSSISYDLTNAAGLLTGQQVLVLNQTYDTNTFEFTTNAFQAFDVTLTNGVNTFIFHATDLAGNTTTMNYNVTLDYSSKTNPPDVQVTWPQNGTQVSGNTFTLDGQVADATVTIAATIVDNAGDTNAANGIVERSGKFWIENLPLNSGTNSVTLTATDVAGNITTTNLNVVQSAVTLTVNPVSDSQLWLSTVNVSGTISDASYAVWVNGVKGHNNGDGTWSVNNVPVNKGGTATFTATGYASNEQQPDGSYGN